MSTNCYLYDATRHRFLSVYDGFILGRTEGNETYPNDSLLSRSHFRLRVANGTVSLEDLGSTNKTRVSGAEVPPKAPRRLREYEIIEAGNQRFVYCTQNKVPPPIGALPSGSNPINARSPLPARKLDTLDDEDDQLLENYSPNPQRRDSNSNSPEIELPSRAMAIELESKAEDSNLYAPRGQVSSAAPRPRGEPLNPYTGLPNHPSTAPSPPGRRRKIQVAGVGVGAAPKSAASSGVEDQREPETNRSHTDVNWRSLSFYRDELIEFRKIREWPKKAYIAALLSLALPAYLFDSFQEGGAFEDRLIYSPEQLATTLAILTVLFFVVASFSAFVLLRHWSNEIVSKELIAVAVVAGLSAGIEYTALEELDWISQANQNSLVYHCANRNHRAHCRAKIVSLGATSFATLPQIHRNRIRSMLGDQFPLRDVPATRAAKRLPAGN